MQYLTVRYKQKGGGSLGQPYITDFYYINQFKIGVLH